MKISFFQFDWNPTGGAYRYLLRLRHFLEEKGTETSLFACMAAEHADEFVGAGKNDCRVFFPDLEETESHLDYNGGLYGKILEFLGKVEPDIVHVNNFQIYYNTALRALRGRVTVQTVHDFAFTCPVLNTLLPDGTICDRMPGFGCACRPGVSPPVDILTALRNTTRKRFSKERAGRRVCISYGRYFSNLLGRELVRRYYFRRGAVNRFIVPSVALGKRVEEYTGVRTVHIPQFLDLEKYPSTPGSAMAPEERILFVGYIVPGKGLDVLLRAVALIGGDFPGLILHVVGKGPHAEDMIALSKELGIGNRTVFRGHLGEQEMLEEYARAWVMVLPAVYPENSPLTIVEAMASGRAVIASDTGGIPEIVNDGVTGRLFPRRDHRKLAGIIAALLSDRKRLEDFGRAGRKFAEETFDREIVLPRYLSIYEDLRRHRMHHDKV